MDGNDVVEAFARGECLDFEADGTRVSLAKDDVLAEPVQRPGFTALSDHGVTVVLDTNLTPELSKEGYAREVISKLQTMRKEAGLEVTDRIQVLYECEEVLSGAICRHAPQISAATLALSIVRKQAGADWFAKEWDINGLHAVLAIKKGEEMP
jgi:isoleucyl-tRNA synthetase